MDSNVQFRNLSAVLWMNSRELHFEWSIQVIAQLVSASVVKPTDRWLNIWCIWHTKVETLQEFRSRHRIGWIIQDLFQDYTDVCVAFFNVPPGNKDAVMTNAYQDQLHAGVSKVCEIFKVCGIKSLKYVQEFYTPVCYCGDISTPRNMMLNETNCDWLFDMLVKRPHGQALANEGCHGFQTFSCQSEGLAMRDYCSITWAWLA